MKKLILIIPFIFILFSCGENNSVSLNGGNGTGGESSQSSAGGGDVTNPDGSGGTSVDVKDPEGGTGVDTTVVVDPGGGTGSDVVVVVDPIDPGGTGHVVIVHPDEEEEKQKQEKEKQAINHSISTTAFNAIDISKLYYRSTLKNSEDLANYDNVYNALKVFYGEQNKDAECTAGVLCHATDTFVDDDDIVGVVWCLDDNGNVSDKCKELGGLGNERYVVVINGEKWEMPTVDEVYGNGVQRIAWRDANCMKPNGERGYYTNLAGQSIPVCSDLEYSLKVADKKYSSVIGVPVVRSGVTTGSPYLSIPEIEKLVQLDMHNLYLFGITNDMWSPAYKIQPLSNFSSTDDLHTQWVTQMQAIHKKLYDVYGDYTTNKYDFETLNKMFWSVASYYENGASDIAGILDLDEMNTGKLNNIGYARALAFVCQLASSDNCVYVEGKARYSTGTGNRGGQEFDHAWLKVRKVGKYGAVRWYNYDPVRNLSRDYSGGLLEDDIFYHQEYTANNRGLLPITGIP